jgi:PKD repeat protein
MIYKIFIILSFFMMPIISLAQLAGVYTIGGLNPDFNTITQAIDTLHNAGMSGPVIFKIRNGIYNENLNLSYLRDTITVQSESGDSSSVVIINSNHLRPGVYGLNSTVILKQLTIVDSVNNPVNMNNCFIYNCRIIGISDKLIFNITPTVINCFIDGNIDCNEIEKFMDNEITGNITAGYVNIFEGNNVHDYFSLDGGGNINNNIFHAPVDIFYGYYNFNNNIIIDSSLAHGLTVSSCDSANINQNIIYGKFQIDHTPHLNVVNNRISGELDIYYSDSCKIVSNKLLGTVDIYYSDNFKIINNYFYKHLVFSFSNFNSFFFNNFSSDKDNYLRLIYSYYNLIQNNIMPALFDDTRNSLTNLLTNNDFPFGGNAIDSHPFYINPIYLDSTDLHATNSQLAGKAIQISTVLYDEDSVSRSSYPTVGANEICTNSDTINGYCGDSITLSICNLPKNGNYFWSPGIGLNNINVSNPKLHVSSNGWYVITDSVSNFSDSVYVKVLSFIMDAGIDDSTRYCSERIELYATYNESAIYTWHPIDHLSNTNSYSTIADPVETTTYIVTADVPGCGASIDSITVFVDPLPIAIASIDSIQNNYIGFHNTSICSDSYLWDFGDDQSSTVTNPQHIFTSIGSFQVTLIACNTFGCDTFTGYVFVDSLTVIDNYETLIDDPAILINSNKRIEISVKGNSNYFFRCYNLMGELILKRENLSGNSFFSIENFSNGVYFLWIYKDNKKFVKKFIVGK